jgi:hypothetical protein
MKQIWAIFRSLVIEQPPIPPSNPRIKKTHKKIWIQNEIKQNLDVW